MSEKNQSPVAQLETADQLLAFAHHFLPYGEMESFRVPAEAVEGLRKLLETTRGHIQDAKDSLTIP